MAKTKKKIKGCDGKIGYKSKEDAENAMFGMIRKKKNGIGVIVKKLNVYGCRCGKFHIGGTRQIKWDIVNKLGN